MARIGFIGLGNMGGGMAANLVKAGHEVRAFDLSGDALAHARDNGCETFTDAAEAVRSVEAVVTMLPNGAIVKQVYASDVIGQVLWSEKGQPLFVGPCQSALHGQCQSPRLED